MNKIMTLNGTNIILLDTDTSKVLKKDNKVTITIDKNEFTISYENKTPILENTYSIPVNLVDCNDLDRLNMLYVGAQTKAELLKEIEEKGFTTYKGYRVELNSADEMVCTMENAINGVIVR